jgi:hypothetical protein
MTEDKCKRANRASGVVELDLSRLGTPDRYSIELSVGVCENCGHVGRYSKSHHVLCDWLDRGP